MTDNRLLHPRPIDLPTELPLDGPIDPEITDNAKIFAAPGDPADWPRWRERLAEWRTAARSRWPYDDGAYTRPSATWASRCFSVAKVWLWDERLFDHDAQRFDVDAFLESTAGYGGFDAVVLWQAYPIIGIDERTQFDFYRDVPSVADVVHTFRDRGIKVFVDYNPWDTATGDADDHPDLVAGLVDDFGADGVFLDTMTEAGAALRSALAALTIPPVLEGESRISLERIEDHQLSWAQWFADSPAPGVMRARWFERRHLLHHTRRWNRDHSEELQSSWMNGAGMFVWDTVFGSWVGWNERDKATLRSMLRVQRMFADVLTRGEWTPLVDAGAAALAAGVFASRFRLGATTLWTIVNRGRDDYRGPVLEVDDAMVTGATSWFDVTTGSSLTSAGDDITVPARGVTGVAAISGDIPPPIAATLDRAAADTRSADTTFPARLPRRRPVEASGSSVPDAPAIFVEPGRRSLTITYRLRETGMYDGAPFVEAWKPLPPLLHSEVSASIEVDVGAVAVASAEVTNRDFAEFVDATGYAPAVPHRFAAHWHETRRPPDQDTGDNPMTFVDLADARAYASWRGARLPTEFEWQLAAEQPSFTRREPLVWNLTESEHSDGVTRFVILKGGSAYEATASEWYFDGGPRPPSFCAKLLLGGLGVTRSSRVGFRLAWDLGAAPPEEDAER